MTALTFSVFGTPAPQGSKRYLGNGVVVESSAKVRPWREDVRQAALVAMDDTPEWDRDTRAVHVSLVFSLPRPRAHYRTGKDTRHLLREDAPAYVPTRPDLDKLIRSTGDALASAGVYADDNRLASLKAVKAYTPGRPDTNVPGLLDRPGVVVLVAAVDQ